MVDMDKIISQEIKVMKMKEKIENKIIFNYFNFNSYILEIIHFPIKKASLLVLIYPSKATDFISNPSTLEVSCQHKEKMLFPFIFFQILLY